MPGPDHPTMKRRTATLLAAVALASAGGQAARGQGWNLEHPEAEFHIARLMPSGSQAYRGGYRQWYAIDWPEAGGSPVPGVTAADPA